MTAAVAPSFPAELDLAGHALSDRFCDGPSETVLGRALVVRGRAVR